MIRAFDGVITDFDDQVGTASVLVAGVHYEIRIPAFATEWARALENSQSTARVHIYEYATQHDSTSQFVAFPNVEEREFFRKFVDVPKLGPLKAAQALQRPIIEIAQSIEQGDQLALASLPGIGKRLSQTIIAHLQGKLEFLLAGTTIQTSYQSEVHSVATAVRNDAVSALMALQFSRIEAEKAVEDALSETDSDPDLDTLLRRVLDQR
ncbi:MAG: Holliday junction branch migration protein RuvA [Chloroflexota bacterium]|nr:Holliday junction branch migration protein RuvA [Chloroflexota bacterium]